MKEKQNLNNLKIKTDGEPIGLSDYSKKLIRPNFDEVEVVFRDLETKLVKLINEYKNDLIFGSIAWLTSEPILEALSKCRGVQIVVQKEDFLRPDQGGRRSQGYPKKLFELYQKISFPFERYNCKSPMGNLSILGDPTVDGIRCVGNHNSDKNPAFPRAHNKFLVFCRSLYTGNGELADYFPTAVWTGSFNLTKNATYSFENALILRENTGKNEVLNSFLLEHHQIFALSEPLDWRSSWVAPEFRIGT